MRNLLILISALAITTSSFAQKRTIAGVTFPASIKEGEKTLYYNGAGLREKFFIDLYVGALYLEKPTMSASKVINNDEAMSIKIEIVSKRVTRDKFTDAVAEGFENSTGGNTSKFSSEIKQFKECLSAAFTLGDKIDITYTPGVGTKVYKNGRLNGTIKGLAFKKALFGIWFCDKPADSGLKNDMLGRL